MSDQLLGTLAGVALLVAAVGWQVSPAFRYRARQAAAVLFFAGLAALIVVFAWQHPHPQP